MSRQISLRVRLATKVRDYVAACRLGYREGRRGAMLRRWQEETDATWTIPDLPDR